MNDSFSSRVIIASDVLWRVVGEEAVLLNLKTEQYLGLDSIGTRMWTVLINSPCVQDGYDVLLHEYNVEPERLRQDLDEFLQKLLQEALIELGSTETVSEVS